MLPIGNADIRFVGVGVDGTSRCRVGDDERLDVAAFVLGEFGQPDAAGGAAFTFLDRADDEDFADQALAVTALERIVEGAIRDAALIDLDVALQRSAIRIDHRPAQLVQQQPSGLVRSQTELGLELERRD